MDKENALPREALGHCPALASPPNNPGPSCWGWRRAIRDATGFAPGATRSLHSQVCYTWPMDRIPQRQPGVSPLARMPSGLFFRPIEPLPDTLTPRTSFPVPTSKCLSQNNNVSSSHAIRTCGHPLNFEAPSV
jgi:hypothetical protein